MKNLNKIASVFCAAALGLLTMTSCEGGDLFSVDAPDWISAKADSIAKEKEGQGGQEIVVEGLEEDVYDIGNAEFTAPFFTLGKTYVVPAGQKWQSQFYLTVNPDNKYYKNFFIVVNGYNGGLGDEYFVMRFDNDPTKNSEWNTTGTEFDRNLVVGNFTNTSGTDDLDPSVQNMNGKITLTVDRSEGGLYIQMTNGTLVKEYKQGSSFPSTGSDVDICCRVGVEGSFVNFLGSTIEPIGGFTSASDKEPVSMVLNNVPDEVIVGTSLEDAVANITATVTFEEGVVKDVKADELTFQAIPDLENPGEKTLVAVYNKTFKGEAAETPIIANAKFNVVLEIVSIEIVKKPSNMTYYFYDSPAVEGVDRALAFDPTGMEVKATYADGTTAIINNAKIHADQQIPTIAGTYSFNVVTNNGKTAKLEGIVVKEASLKKVSVSPTNLGAEDNSTGWWSVFTDDMKVPAGSTYQVDFTNYAGGSNWNNFVIILRNAAKGEYAVVRADNYGWGNGYAAALVGPGQSDWVAWLAAMNGAKCSAYITNSGNGTADVQVVMNGNDGNTYYQYYSGINTVDPSDLYFSFTVDGSHLVFE